MAHILLQLMVMAPLLLLMIVAVTFLYSDDDVGIVITVPSAIAFFAFATVGVVTASRIYQWIGAGNP